MSVYLATCQPGDVIFGMDLSHGGHLTHGHPLNYSGKTFKVVPYLVRQDTETIDYDALRDLAQAAQAEAHRVRRLGLPADHRLQAHRRHRPRGRARWSWPTSRTSRAWSRSGCTPRRCPTASSSPPPPTRPCAARAAAWSCARPSCAEALDKAVFPGVQGGPLMHIIAAKARRLRRGAAAVLPRLHRASSSRTRRSCAPALQELGWRMVSGGTDNHLMLINLGADGISGKKAEDRLGQGRHHGQQEHRALRHAEALHRLRHPHRHPGRHHPRHGGGRDEGDRRADRPRAAHARTRRCGRGSRTRSRR